MPKSHIERDRLLLQQTEVLAKTGSWELNLSTNELYWSEGVYRILEMEPTSDLVDFDFAVSVIHPDDRTTAFEAMNQAVKSGSGYKIHKRFVTLSGAIKQIHSIAVIAHDEDGHPTKLIGVFHDITDLMEAQQKLSESESLLAESQRLTQMGSWNFDFRTDTLTWSEAMYDVFGADKTSFLENHGSFLNLIVPEDRDLAESTSKRSQKTGEPFHVRYRILTPAGELRHIEEFGYSEKDADGNILRLFGTAQNITERFKSEHLYRNLVEHGADAIAIIGVDGRPTYVSPSITNVLGYSEKEALELNLFTIIHPDDVEGVTAKMTDVMQNPGLPIKGYTSRTLHKDGSWRWLEATITNLMDDPYIQGIVDNFRDVTDSVNTSHLEHLERVMMEESIKEGTELDRILTDYVKGIETIFPGLHCAIMAVLDGNLYTRVAPSLPDELNQAFNGKPIGPNAGSCGTTAYTGKPVIVSDIATDPLWKPYRKIALAHGLHACWSQPVFDSKGAVMATFANYYPTAKAPSEKELELFMRSASLLGVIMESHKRLQAMFESNERFEYATQATSDAIYDWDVVRDVFTWGDGYYRLFGYPKTDDPYRLADWIAMTHTDDEVAHADRWNQFINDPHQNQWTNSFRFLRHDGRYAYVEESGYLIRNTEGKPVRMIGVIRDETTEQLKKIQQTVQHDLAEKFTVNTDLDITLTHALEQLSTFLGFETAEIWLKNYDSSVLNLMSTYPASDRGKAFYKQTKSFQQFKMGEGLPGSVWKDPKRHIWNEIDTKKEFLRRDAAKIVGLKSAIALPLSHNDVFVGVMLFGSTTVLNENDVRFDVLNPLEDFLGAEIKRKQQENELHNFFNSSPDILAIASPKGHFVKVNPAFCTLLGYTSEELASQPFETFMHPDDRGTTLQEFKENISGSRLANGFLNRYITKSGDIVWISWNSSDVFGEDGFMFAYGRNVTELVRLQALFDNSAKLAKIGSWAVDLVKQTVYWSPITYDIHEVELNVVPDLETSINYYREDVRDKIREAIGIAIKENQTWDLELPIITAKGNERWIRTIGKPEYLNGECLRIFGSFQDIHARKTAELALLASNLEKTNILESIGDGFFTVDRDFNVTYWNRMAEEYLKTPRDKILGKNLWLLFPDATKLPSYENYRRAMNENIAIQFDDYYEVVDLWFDISAYPSESGLSVFFKDITKQRKSEKRFQIVTEATNDAIWDYDVVNDELFWGKGFLTQFGHDPDVEKPTFNRLLSLIHPEDRERIGVNVEAYFRNPESKNWFEEYRFLKADGTYANVVDRAVFIRNTEGRVTRVVGAMSDISYRKSYEESLKQLNQKLEQHTKELEISNAELEQFAYVASHDLQEPLRMITSFLTQLERKYSDKLDAKAHQYIHFAVDGASRMRNIILDLLEFSRIGRMLDDKATFPLKELIDEYLLLRGKLIEEKSAIVRCDSLPILTTYRTPLSQVLNNLLDNAIKYAKSSGKPEIKISSKLVDGYWQISIQDNGIGISNEYFDKIFVIFQRLHDKTEYVGTGMGLAIVKKIVDNLGGRIWVESEEGVGSTFTFTIPES
jgi:PAS domain S-box-containing protein